MIVECAHVEYSWRLRHLLTLSSAAAREFALCYPGWRHPDDWSSVSGTGRPRAALHGDALTAAVEMLTRHRTRIGTGPRNTSWLSVSSISLLSERTLLCASAGVILRRHHRTAVELFLHNTLWTDEACFTRENMQNVGSSHLCARNNPHHIPGSECQVRFRVRVWAGIFGTLTWAPKCYMKGWPLSDNVTR
jgi:hypothetical protein